MLSVASSYRSVERLLLLFFFWGGGLFLLDPIHFLPLQLFRIRHQTTPRIPGPIISRLETVCSHGTRRLAVHSLVPRPVSHPGMTEQPHWCVPSMPFGGSCPELNDIVLGLSACLSLLDGGRRVSPMIQFPFGLSSVISMVHASALKMDCCSLLVRVLEVRKVAMSFLFGRNFAVHQVLNVGMWSAQSTFSALYLRDVTHRHLDTFSIGPVVMAQHVM